MSLYGQFRFFELRQLSSVVKLEVPFFQRVLYREKIDLIKKQLINERDFLKVNDVIQAGTIHVGIINNVYYIMDGQHRLRAYQELNSPDTVMCQLWSFLNEEEMLQKFKEINSNTPLEDYISLDNGNNILKLVYDKIIEYVETNYKVYLKTTDTPIWPNINPSHFRKLVDKIEDLKESTIDNYIYIFEKYNQKCRDILLSGNNKDKERVEKEDKKCQKYSLYINRDIIARMSSIYK